MEKLIVLERGGEGRKNTRLTAVDIESRWVLKRLSDPRNSFKILEIREVAGDVVSVGEDSRVLALDLAYEGVHGTKEKERAEATALFHPSLNVDPVLVFLAYHWGNTNVIDESLHKREKPRGKLLLFQAGNEPAVVHLVKGFPDVKKEQVALFALLKLIVIEISDFFDVSFAGALLKEADLRFPDHPT